MSPGRLLVITYHFGPEGAVGGLRWAGIAKYLARMGWQVTVITGAPQRGARGRCGGVDVEYCPRWWTSFDGFQLLRRRALKGGGGPARNGGPPAARPPGLLRRLRAEAASVLAFPDEGRGWICRAALRARSVVRRLQPDVIVSSGPPHSAHLVAGLAAMGSGARWLVDLRDPWAGPLTETWTSDSRAGTGVFRALSPCLEALVFRAADGLITSTRELGVALAAGYPGVAVTHISNGVDRESLPASESRQYPGLGVVHAGTLYTGRDLGPVVRALGTFLERHPEAALAGTKLRVAGTAEPGYAEAFWHVVAAAGMERHVEVLGRLPRAGALEVVSRSRLAVVLAQEQELQIPAKLYESVALGIPTLVIAPPGSAAGVEGTRVGAMVRDGTDVRGIADVLEQVWQNGLPKRQACSAPITYDAIAPSVDLLLRGDSRLGAARLSTEVTASS